MLSSNTDWANVERVIPQLGEVFQGYSLTWYAALTPPQVAETVVPWIRNNGAGCQFLGKDLTNLIQAAVRLSHRIQQYGSVEAYLNSLLQQSGNDVIEMVLSLGGAGSQHKLPALGIPLAAEFLKNLGYNVAKPDRHVNRAVGSFGWVTFRTWDRKGKEAPKATPAELRLVMRVMAEFAGHNGLRGCFVDNAVWLLGAKSGLGLDNAALATLAGQRP